MQVFAKKTRKNLVNSKKNSTFAPAFQKWYMVNDQMVNALVP